MTFQVGIIATGGVVLASDLAYTYPGEPLAVGASRAIQKPKIFISEDRKIACCASGDDVSASIAETSVNRNDLPIEFWQHLVCRAQGAIPPLPAGETRRYHGAVLACDRGHLWHVEVKQPFACPLAISLGYVCEGDRSNPAGYFLERYARDRRLSLESAIFIAAHSVLVAGLLNPRGVQGLEIVVWKDDTFRHLNEDELNELRERSRALDSQVAGLLGIPLP